MKIRHTLLAVCCLALMSLTVEGSGPKAGFFLPDSVAEITLKYRTVKDLIILPVTLNDSLTVNLILDSGCRNLILFGKRFRNRLRIHPGKRVEFSGLGSGRPVSGGLSVGNKVNISQVLGSQIPIVVVGNNNLFGKYHNVDGVIGYDIFVKFEVEINATEQTITFRSATHSLPPEGYTQVPLRIVDSRPVMSSEVFVDRKTSRRMDLMIDTGSSLSLLLKTTKIEDFGQHRNEKVLGIGLNGPVSGYETVSARVKIRDFEINRVSTGIVSSEWHNNASIGMEILKEYVVILNYCKAYACFKKVDA